MPAATTSDHEFIALFEKHGASKTAKIVGITERNVYARRERLQRKYIRPVTPPTRESPLVKEYPHRIALSVKNGCVIVGSDFHIWPGSAGPALRAFKLFCRDMQPAAVVLNGDILDFPRISRHPPMGWETAPTPIEEIEAAQDHLNDIVAAVPRKCLKAWTLGNHDARFETRLATVASEYKGIKGIHLSDHFPLWEKGWSCLVNENTMIKHRFKGGMNAPRANTLNAGLSMVTGHLHSQKVTPLTDYNGTRYGVDSGCVADTDHKAFTDYTEDAPLDWRSGFCVLSYSGGDLLMPELVSVWDTNHVQFRGKLIKV